ncbi:MAG: AAA family ATPase [Blastocatellales bacterium]|nr:AAA family ATPase [Blastocatellales bacterium]
MVDCKKGGATMTPYPILAPVVGGIPPDLRKLPQWVIWRADWQPDKAKYNKIPIDAKTLNLASSTNPATWTDFGHALSVYEQNRERFAGVGFVVTEDDDFVGVDLDGCVEQAPDGSMLITAEAQRWIEHFGSYAEFSPSGHGNRIFVKGHLPPGGRKRGTVEIYEDGRFLTLTGRSVVTPPLPIAERQREIEEFHAEVFAKTERQEEKARTHARAEIPDDELLQKAFQARNGATICALYSGNWSGYGSQSEADLALCSKLAFWTGPDSARLDDLFRKSKLMRDKWDKRHYGDGATYGEATIRRAIDDCREFYRWNGHTQKNTGDQAAGAAAGAAQGAATDDQPIIQDVCLADVTPERVEWLWQGRIPLGALTILEGIEGEGKSTLLCAVAAAITLGSGLPDSEKAEPGSVLWLSAEDDLARVLKPRLMAAGADCGRVFAVGEPFALDTRGILGLRERVAERMPRLAVIDPIFAYTRGDANKGSDSRSLTNELKTIAEQFNVAVVLVRHVGKSKGFGDPRAAGLYSIEWRAAARSVLLAGSDPDTPQRRALTHSKNNFGPLAESIGYVVEPDALSPSGARFYWTGKSELTARRILAAAGDEEERSGRREAEDFLRDALQGGERPAKDIQRDARTLGISETTLNRTKRALGVLSKKLGGNFGGKPDWHWCLPAEDGPEGGLEDGHTLVDDHLQANRSGSSTSGNGLAEDGQFPKSDHLQDHLQGGDHLQPEEGEL